MWDLVLDADGFNINTLVYVCVGVAIFIFAFYILLFCVIAPMRRKHKDITKRVNAVVDQELQRGAIEIAKEARMADIEVERAGEWRPRVCKYCGSQYAEGDTRCPSCGSRI